MGGGAFMGLCSKLAGVRTFEKALELAAKGSQTHCDLTTRDMLGDEMCARMPALGGDISLSLFGTLALDDPKRTASVVPADLARSLVYMTAHHCSELAYLFCRMEVCDFTCN